MGSLQGIHKNNFIASEDVQNAFNNYDVRIPNSESVNELNTHLFPVLD